MLLEESLAFQEGLLSAPLLPGQNPESEGEERNCKPASNLQIPVQAETLTALCPRAPARDGIPACPDGFRFEGHICIVPTICISPSFSFNKNLHLVTLFFK